jgi:hypothetical protein
LVVRKISDEEKRHLQLQLARKIHRCREDPNEFIRTAMRIEGGKPPIQEGVHVDLQNFLTENNKCVIRLPVGSGKSNQITRWRILWELGRNPNLRVGIVSASKSGVPTKVLDGIKTDIEQNRWVRYIFPGLKPRTKPSRNWTATSITVERDDATSDPSIQLFGLGGNILGSRLDLVVLDDIHNIMNSTSRSARDKIYDFVTAEVFSRGGPNGMRVWAVGHRWHKEDLLERLTGPNHGWPDFTKSAFVPDGKGGEKSFIPYMWTIEQLRERERALGVRAGPMLRNRLTDLENARFKREWFDRALERGRGMRMPDAWNPQDSPTFTGVDLSMGKSKDCTVVFTFTVLNDGTRRPLDIRKGKWQAPQIVENLVDVHNRYGSIISVENNGGQDFLLQFARHLNAVPLRGHVTGQNKHNHFFGVESMALEFANGLWALPNTDEGIPEMIEQWIMDMLNYNPDPREHTSDLIMAAWIARENARLCGYTQASGVDGMDNIEEFMNVDTLVR